MAMVQSLERAAFELSRVLPAFSARSFNAGSKAFFPPLKGLSPIPSASASSFSVPSIRVNSGRGFASFPGDSFAYLSPRRTPAHLGLIVVAQQEAYVLERFGKFNRILPPGLNFAIPFVDRIAYVHSLKETAIPVPNQSAITRDNVSIHIDGVLYVRVVDPYKASYGAENAMYAVVQLAQTAMRSEIGKITLDKTFEEREQLNHHILEAINQAAMAWGLEALRYEIRDISPPPGVRAAMELQAEAERRKRAQILESEGEKESKINRAMAEKTNVILYSEAQMEEQINRAKGEAEAIRLNAQATSDGIKMLAQQLMSEGGREAVSLRVAESYIAAFSKLAKSSTTLLMPSNAGDPSAMVAQAMAIFKTTNEVQFGAGTGSSDSRKGAGGTGGGNPSLSK